MTTTQTKIQRVPVRPLSREQVRRYFYPKRQAYWPYIGITAGVAWLVIAGLLHFWPLLLLSSFSLVISSTFIYQGLKLNPSDTEFDHWIDRQARTLYSRGLEALCLTSDDLIDSPIRITSYVLPGSSTASDYPPQQVHMKQGKDGTWRFSIYVYTFIYPLEDYLAVYRGDVNIFSPRPIEHHETYLYQHIYSAGLRAQKDTLAWEGHTIPYRIEQLCLKLFHGENVELSAAIKAMPQAQADLAPLDALPNPSFERKLLRLRQLLHARNRLV